MNKFFKIIIVLLSLSFTFEASADESINKKQYIGAAPRENGHRFTFGKRLDTSGGLHMASPPATATAPNDNLGIVRGPDVLAGCASRGMSFANPTLCESLENLLNEWMEYEYGSNTINQNGLVLASATELDEKSQYLKYASNDPSKIKITSESVEENLDTLFMQYAFNAQVKMREVNNMSTDSTCLSVAKNFFMQNSSYTDAQKKRFNTCRAYCNYAIDSIENRNFCDVKECLKLVKRGSAEDALTQYCVSMLRGWVQTSSGSTQQVIDQAITSLIDKPSIPDPAICIDIWSSSGEINPTKSCCENINILFNYFPEDRAKIQKQCKSYYEE